jgi:hypothetical protein
MRIARELEAVMARKTCLGLIVSALSLGKGILHARIMVLMG